MKKRYIIKTGVMEGYKFIGESMGNWVSDRDTPGNLYRQETCLDLENAVTIYTVYRQPKDYPDKFVIVKFFNDVRDDKIFSIADTLEDVRKTLPRGLYRLNRHMDDDRVIVETWL